MSFREHTLPARRKPGSKHAEGGVLVRVSLHKSGMRALKFTIGSAVAMAAGWEVGFRCVMHIGEGEDLGKVRICPSAAAHGSVLRKIGSGGVLGLSFAEVPEFCGKPTGEALPAEARLVSVSEQRYDLEVEMPRACVPIDAKKPPAPDAPRHRPPDRTRAHAPAPPEAGRKAVDPAKIAPSAVAPPARAAGTVAIEKDGVRVSYRPPYIEHQGKRVDVTENEARFLGVLARSLNCVMGTGNIAQSTGRGMPSAPSIEELQRRLPSAGLKLTHTKPIGYTLAKS